MANEQQRVLWYEETDQQRTTTDHWYIYAKEEDEDLIDALEQLLQMARNKEITGLAAAITTPGSGIQLIVAGESFDKPYTAISGATRLIRTIETLIPDIEENI